MKDEGGQCGEDSRLEAQIATAVYVRRSRRHGEDSWRHRVPGYRRLGSVVIVLDTHVLVWRRTCPDQLSKAAADAIRTELKSDCVSIAAVTLWELSWLATNGRIDPGGTVPAFLKKMNCRGGVPPLDGRNLCAGGRIPYPKDPADRLIGATALTSGTNLVTKNNAIRRSSLVRTIW